MMPSGKEGCAPLPDRKNRPQPGKDQMPDPRPKSKPRSGPASAERRLHGFEPAGKLLSGKVRAAGEKRGFAVARLLTQWDTIAGDRLAAVTRPVKVSYPREGLGATLTLLVAPATGPEVQMAIPQLIERVNAVYGYRAISRIALTQTAATGFAEGQTPFTAAPRSAEPAAPDPARLAAATAPLAPIADPGLKGALELLARNILTRRTSKEGPPR